MENIERAIEVLKDFNDVKPVLTEELEDATDLAILALKNLCIIDELEKFIKNKMNLCSLNDSLILQPILNKIYDLKKSLGASGT